jgi:LPXTG-motif cell wall-anchored protein
VRRILCAVLLVATGVTIPATVAHAADTQFTLTTNYTGLYPDADVSVPVTVHNPLDYDLAVHTARVHVGDANPDCTAQYLEASSYAGDVVAPSQSDATIVIRMHMLASAPDACQGATFPLSFVASGAPVGVQPSSGNGSNGFAFTGADSLLTTLVGAAALVSGLALIFVRRRRPAGASS